MTYGKKYAVISHENIWRFLRSSCLNDFFGPRYRFGKVVKQGFVFFFLNFLGFETEIYLVVDEGPQKVHSVGNYEVEIKSIFGKKLLVIRMAQKLLFVLGPIFLLKHGNLFDVPHTNQGDWVCDHGD